jgi:fatty acid desaturase
MTTTAEEPTTAQPTAEPTIDVELPTTPASRAERTPARAPKGNRRTRVTVRRFGLWSVFKFALIFSVCMMVVVWLALMLIFFALQAAGVVDSFNNLLGCVINAKTEGTKGCVAASIDGVRLFTTLFGVGLVMAAASAILWTFIALIYNLISDIVGGVEVVLAEKRA